MVEAVLGFVLAWWTVVALMVFVFWLVHGESEGWAIFWLIVASVIAFFTFNVDAKTIGYSALAYIPIGLFWSFFRWRRHCNRKVEKFNEDKKTYSDVDGDYSAWDEERYLEQLKSEIDPASNVSRVVQWIIIWPFSMLDNILGDIYDMLVNLVRRHLISLYRRISDNALKRID